MQEASLLSCSRTLDRCRLAPSPARWPALPTTAGDPGAGRRVPVRACPSSSGSRPGPARARSCLRRRRRPRLRCSAGGAGAPPVARHPSHFCAEPPGHRAGAHACKPTAAGSLAGGAFGRRTSGLLRLPRGCPNALCWPRRPRCSSPQVFGDNKQISIVAVMPQESPSMHGLLAQAAFEAEQVPGFRAVPGFARTRCALQTGTSPGLPAHHPPLTQPPPARC